jgi:hypothetical protein
MSRKRLSTVIIVLAIMVCAAIGSWFAGSSIKSPAEVAARTAPPSPSPILVPVEQRVLSSVILTRGTGRFGLPQPITIVPSLQKPQAGVITTLPRRNQQLTYGDVLLTASGRPAFILAGDVPVYRDMVLGSTGRDIRQLKLNLNRLGFNPGSFNAEYDLKTSQAVGRWYASAGWEPFAATSEQLGNIGALEQELATAMLDKVTAEDAIAAAPQAVIAARARADNANQIAAAEVAARTAERDRLLRIRSKKSDRARAKAELELAQVTAGATKLEGEVDIQAAIDAQKTAERELQLAEAKAKRLAAALEIARQKATIKVPADEIVFVPELPVRVEELSAALGDYASGTVMAVTDNQIAIDSSLPLDQAALVKPGMAVAIDESALGIKTNGVVHRVASTSGTNGVDGYHVYFEVRVASAATSLVGFSLRLTIPIESTGGAVNVVPISALSLATDGTSRVQVDHEGTLSHMVVEPGLSAEGFVEVTPVDGELKAGQLVVIGYERKETLASQK